MQSKPLPNFTNDIADWARRLVTALKQNDYGVDPGVVALAKVGRVPHGWKTLADTAGLPEIPLVDSVALYVWIMKE